MSSVGELRQELQRESLSRQRQEELNAKLQDEYDQLLKKLAVAELHIDRLRLDSSVDVSKRFVISHDVEQHARLKDQLGSQPDPSTRVYPESDHANEVRVINTELHEDRTDSDEAQSIEEVKVAVKSHSGGLSSQVSLDNASSKHSTDGPEDNSQMSDTSIANWASVESNQMAHLFQAHNLQEQITALKERINRGGVSVSEIVTSLGKIQEEHQTLVRDISRSTTDLDALNRKYGGRTSRHIVHSQEAVGDELSGLAEQLKELEELLQTKAQEMLPSSPPTSSTPVTPSSARRSDTSTSDGEGGGLTDDSFDCPNLPSKYICKHGETHSPLTSTPPPISSQPSELDITLSTVARCEGMEAQNTLSEFSDAFISGDLSGQSNQLLHHRSSPPAPRNGNHGSPPAPSDGNHGSPPAPSDEGGGSSRSTQGGSSGRMHTSTYSSLLVENELTSPPPSQPTNPTIASSHPPLADSPPPSPLPVAPQLHTTLSGNNSGIRDIHLPLQSPPYHHYPHLDHAHLKVPPTSSHYTNSDGTSPLPHGFESAPYPSRRSPSDWTSPGEADSGFAGSELPQRKPDSICPPMVGSSYQSMGESGEEDQQNGLPSLTSGAIDALRAELEDLKLQILHSPKLQSGTPYQHSRHTGTPSPHSRRGTHKEPLTSMKTTTGLHTWWKPRDKHTLQTAFSEQTAPSTLNEATGTFAGGSVPWQPPTRPSHRGTQANHLLQSTTPLSPLAHRRRLSTPVPSLHTPSTVGRVNLEEDESRQKPSHGHTPTNSESCSSVCGSHRGHDRWVCSKCEGGGAGGNGVTSRLQGQTHRSKRKRGAQVTFVQQERGEIVEHKKRYRMSGQKVPPYRTQHFPHSSDSDGGSDFDSYQQGAKEYRPHLVRESRFQPSVLLGQEAVTNSTPAILNRFQPSVQLSQRPFTTSISSTFQPSVLLSQRPFTTSTPSTFQPSVQLSQRPFTTSIPSTFQPSVLLSQRPFTTSTPSTFQPSVLLGQRPVATSTPANLNKHRSTHYREHFGSSVRHPEPHSSRRGNISGATPHRKWSSYRERVPRGRRSDVRHIMVPTEHESSSEDDQEVGRRSPGQYYVVKKPKGEDYHAGSVTTRTPKSSQLKLLHKSSAPVHEEVYFSDPAVFGVERRRNGVVVMTPRPVEGVYLVEGGHGSVSEVEAVEATPLDLGDACRLARQLNRRSKRVHRTLQMELSSLY